MADPHADIAAHDHIHGQMVISEQVKTWALFKFLAKWSALGLSALLVALTLWFCAGAGFLGGAIGGGAVAVIGFLALRSKKVDAH